MDFHVFQHKNQLRAAERAAACLDDDPVPPGGPPGRIPGEGPAPARSLLLRAVHRSLRKLTRP